MHFKLLLISSVLGLLLGVLKCIQAVPIKAIYTGNSCECPKKVNYFVNMPQPALSEKFEPREYGYKLDYPLPSKAKVTYSFDFEVEEPKTLPPPAEENLDLYAKIDRFMAPKKDCFAPEEAATDCGCHRCPRANRYVPPEASGERHKRNYNHIDNNIAQPSSHIIAIFWKPLKQSQLGVSKPRIKRDLSRIFMRPRKNYKRSERLVKQYNKRLKDVENEKTYFDDTPRLTRSRTSADVGMRPLQTLSSFLNLPNLRNKRDIKGEYDLIEKEREQMDLTIPEIIQYMPETLQPHFKRNQCHFGQSCQRQHHDPTESDTKTTTAASTADISNTVTTEKILANQLPVAENEDNKIKDDNEKEKIMDNSINLPHKKRNTSYYSRAGCPLVFKEHSPTPTPGYTYKTIPSLQTNPRYFGHDPIPQQYVGYSSQSPHPSAIFHNPLESVNYAKLASVQTISNAQLDLIISDIVQKHSDFIQAKTLRDSPLVDTPKVQEAQAKYYLKNVMAAPA